MSSDGRIPVEGSEIEGAGNALEEAIKENASIVGSSLTECKHERENCVGTESISDKGNEELNANIAEGEIHVSGEVENSSSMKNDKRNITRYFIIKSLSHDNIQLSIERGIWATQKMNEPILEEAFHNCDKVILIFSVNTSGFFQGYAQMLSSVGCRRDNVWSKSSGGSNPWGRSFRVKWLRLHDLPFQKTLHLKNPLNDYKPVKISRDCQELSEDVGEALCDLFDEEGGKGNPQINSPVHFPDEDCLLSVPSSHARWAGQTMLHSSMLYQHAAKHEENGCILPQERSTRTCFLQNSPLYMETQNVLPLKESLIYGNMSNRLGKRASFLQSNNKDAPHDGNLAVSLSEEDILNMTYEEYLVAVGRNTMASHPATRTTQGSKSRRRQDDDPYSRYLAEWHKSKKIKSHGESFQ